MFSNAQTRHLVSVNSDYVISNTRSSVYMPMVTDNQGKNIASFDRQSYDGYSFGASYRMLVKTVYFGAYPSIQSVGFAYSSPNIKQVDYKQRESYSFNYISIPVKIGVLVVDRAIKIGIDAGVCYNIPLSAKMHYEYSHANMSIDTRSNIKSPNSTTSVILGANIGFDIAKTFKFEITPQYSIGLSNAINGASINYLSIGASFGYYIGRK